MNHQHMVHDTHYEKEEENLTDIRKSDIILYKNSTSHSVETVRETKEEVREKVVHCKRNIYEDTEHKRFSSSGSLRKQKNIGVDKMSHDNEFPGDDKFLENTEIICTGTDDHCFIVIDSDYEQNKIPLKHFLLRKEQNKIYDVNFNKNISNLGAYLNFTETETYDFYEDITMLNSPSYRKATIDGNSAELIKGKICKIREENNRRHTGVVLLNGFEFFPLDFNVDDDLTETQFYASMRQRILDKNIKDHELNEYFSIIKKEIDNNVRLYEKKTKYTDYLYKFMKKYETKKKNLHIYEDKEKTTKELAKKTNILKESKKIEIFSEKVKQDDLEYIDKINDYSDNYNVLTKEYDKDFLHSFNNNKNNVDTHSERDKVYEKINFDSTNKLDSETFKKYDVIEETLTLSSETTPSISPDQQTKYFIESNNDDCYEKGNDSKRLLSQSSSFILNESDLSDMSNYDEKEFDNLNEEKEIEIKKIFDKNECENLYPLSKEVVSNTINENVHKTIPLKENVDNDECIQEEPFFEGNVNEYKNETYTNVYSTDSHSNQIDCNSNNFSKFESDYQLPSYNTQSIDTSTMDKFLDANIDNNYTVKSIVTHSIPLIEKNINNNLVGDDNIIQYYDKDFNSKLNETIDSISTKLVNEAIKESISNSNNNHFYSSNLENMKNNTYSKIENLTSTRIIEEDFYTTTIEKIIKLEEDNKINYTDKENTLKTIDRKIEKDKLKGEIKSTEFIDNSNDKNIYYYDNKTFRTNDSNNNTNIDIEIRRKNSICSSNLTFQDDIKDSNDFLYINDDKYKIIEKTTVIKEYFKIKDDSDIEKHTNKFLKHSDMNKDLSNNYGSKFNSPCNHKRSKSTTPIIIESKEHFHSSSQESEYKFGRYRSSSQSHLSGENYLINSYYKKKDSLNNGKSIYRSTGSLIIIDNHFYKKLSSEDVHSSNNKNKSICNNDTKMKNFIFDKKEDNNSKNHKFGYDVKYNTYSFTDDVTTIGINNREEWVNDFEKQHNNNLIRKNRKEEDIFRQSKDLSYNKQQTKENIIYSDSGTMQKNIYEDIDVKISSRSNEDNFPYSLEKNTPIKSEEIIKMNRPTIKENHLHNTKLNESAVLKYKNIDSKENQFSSSYHHEPLFSKIKGTKMECSITEYESKNNNLFIQDKPLAVPITYENWEYDSCFSDDHSSVNHDLYLKKNKNHENISTVHPISPVLSFNKETSREEYLSNFRREEYSLSETNSLPMFKETIETDICSIDNCSKQNLLNVCQQHIDDYNDKKEDKILLDTTIIPLYKSSDIEEEKLIIEKDGDGKCLSFTLNNDTKEKSTKKLNIEERSEIPLNYNTFKNIYDTNIIEKNSSDSNETSLVDIVKKVKEQNGIYKYNDTKRKTYSYKKETQIIEDSPSQKNNKSVFGKLRKTTDRSSEYSNSKYSKIHRKEVTSSEDFRNSPIFNKIQKSDKNRFEEFKKDKFNNHITKTFSNLSSDFGEPLHHSSFSLSANYSKTKFEKPIPLISQDFLKQMMTNTRDSSPSSISSEHCNQIINIDENSVLHNWNPEKLISQLYKIDYEPRKESKRNHFINMEGHLEVPNTDTNIIPELEKSWKRRYFKTKEGRLTWYATHYADENFEGDILLSGTDIECDKNEGTFYIHGGMEHAKIKVRVPREPEGLFDKWRRALLSHSSSSILDAYVQPIAKKVPHSTEKVILLDLGSCSIRGGVLTKEPSLPQSFFPAIGVFKNDGTVVVGSDALKPGNRHYGVLHQPIPNTDPAIEKYKINKIILKACIDKVISDLKINPSKYKILLSLPQNIPPTLLGDILKLLLDEGYFNGVSITRQPSLILYSYDVTTGVVVDIGERLNIVPVIDGYIVDNAVINLPYGALQIEDSLRVKLNETNEGFYSFQGPVERMILRYLMEQACYISNDYDHEVQNCKNNDNVEVSLEEFDPTPNMKTKFSVNASRFIATEGLFKPNRWGIEGKGLHQLINDVIQLSPIDSRRTLYKNIYLSGGTSLLPNLAERLENEIMKLVPPTIHIQVHTSPWRYHAAYLGAQVLASSCTFDSNCVSNNQLNDFVNQLKNSAF
uniref:Actin, alpha cardiac muscle 1 (inferred by orthology to a human protein) n=1 Tax=Strongyloides venezuelensis TaxID=75913 RepID=A0A0K0F2M6_STRVS